MTTAKNGRVLVVGDDMRIFLSNVRAFGRAGKTVEAYPYGPSPSLKSRFLSKVHAAPVFDADQQGWRDELMALLRRETFDIVVPCSDPAIIFLDSVRHLLPHQRLAIPARDAMDLFYDKEETHRLCESLGIPMAPSARLAAADTAAGLVAKFGLPLVLKPRRTFFAEKDQAREVVEIADTESGVRHVLGAISERSHYIIEGFFAGEGVGVSVLAKDGKILQAFQHRRLREGQGGASSFRVSEMVNAGLRAACAKVIDRANHTGVCMFEFRQNPYTGAWILIETNARFWGSMALPLALGLDYPNRLYDVMVDGLTPEEQPYRAGVMSRNLLLDGYNLLKRLRGINLANAGAWLRDAGDYAVQPLRWLRGTEYSDSFVLDDVKPALWEFTLLSAKIASSLRQKPERAAMEHAS